MDPAVFAIWMELLNRVAGSVLWLSAHGATAVENLRREAVKRGVAPERLIFAPRLPDRADHLRRVKLADLFLDTFYYNAHTTACDALAAGLPELVAQSHADYAETAWHLATHPQQLSALKAKLEKNKTTHPLFDTPLLVRHLESAYGKMFNRYRAGLAPEQIYI